MNPRDHLAVIGSGASAIYLLKHLLDQPELLTREIGEISLYDKSRLMGTGMPYSPFTTDRYNMSNISSEELPELPVTFADWLRAQEPPVLEELDMGGVAITESAVYPRLALGRYLCAQYRELVDRLKAAGLEVHEHADCEVTDVRDQPGKNRVLLATADGAAHECDRLVIATGHYWMAKDRAASGYYASPWPICKLLPEKDDRYNFAVGTLGASLSAFDVISSLAHRHGDFVTREDGTQVYTPHPGTEKFRIVMHAVKGLLPHLQYDQEEPFREIYRHVDRAGMLALVGGDGFLRLAAYFDRVCRPAMREAFEKDGLPEMVAMMDDPESGLAEMATKLTEEHDYSDAFEGMRKEMVQARDSVLNHHPMHWKETLDDLMYTLNFHAELLPAEDHLTLKAVVMPFLMNVIAAMPLESGESMLALHDAGVLSMVAGRVTIADEQHVENATTITVEDEDGNETTESYQIFIDCGGQKPLEVDDYPFPSLAADGSVRAARSAFAAAEDPTADLPEEKRQGVTREGHAWWYALGGIDIDGAYRLIGQDGAPNPRIHDIAFPHATGVRPYSYGLQACSDTAAILVRTWVEESQRGAPVGPDAEEITAMYEKI
ncbi:MAG: hypothetical protein JWO82_370 [Akkermansiaceae bacterium]|nr:hypothetical protein [Akkermansiaceae bacterium]